jgi:hypothetical protein
MAVDVATRTTFPRVGARAIARVAAVPARLWLTGIVGLSCALRGIAASAHVTSYMLPDEYTYHSLARSIATSGRPLVRDHAAHFPALLVPILTAPFQWLSPATAYHLTQGFDVVAMSLAAVPAYLIARRLGVGERASLACAAVAVASPGMLYAGFILSEPLAYPLSLTAVYAGVRALETPSLRTQAAFLTWTGLTMFARVQYVVLLVAFAGAAFFLEHLRAFKRWPLVAAVLGGGAALGLALGPAHFIGVYAGGAKHGWAVSTLFAWFGRDALLVAYSAGWLLVPAGIVGLTCARTRVERAFAAFVALLVTGLLLEAGWIAAIQSSRFEERYLVLVAPLLAVSFALWAARGAPRKAAVGIATGLMLLFSMRVPLSNFEAFGDKDGSPLLMAVSRLEQLAGVANASLFMAFAAALLSVCLFALVYRPRFALPIGFAVVLAAMTAVSALAYSFDKVSAHHARSMTLPADLQWVDHAGLGSVGLLALPNSDASRSMQQLLWNRSITDILLLDAPQLDVYEEPTVGVSGDGRVLVPGGTFVGPLLVQEDGSRATLSGATRVAIGNKLELWKPLPHAVPRLALLAAGLDASGWLSARSYVRVWPDGSGRVEGALQLRLWIPRGMKATSLKLDASGYRRTLRLAPGVTYELTVPVSQRGAWTLNLSTPTPFFVDLHAVGAKAASPVFTRTVAARVTSAASSARYA